MMRLRAGKFSAWGATSRGEFAEDGAAGLEDLVEELGVVGRVAVGQAAAEDGDGASLGAECAAVCGGVDAASAAGDDGDAAAGEDAGEALGLLDAVGGAGAGADDGGGVSVVGVGAEIAEDIEDGGRVGDLAEEAWVAGLAERQEGDAELVGAGELGVGEGGAVAQAAGDLGGGGLADASDAFELFGAGGEGGDGGAEPFEECGDASGAEAWGEAEPEDGVRGFGGRVQGGPRVRGLFSGSMVPAGRAGARGCRGAGPARGRGGGRYHPARCR